MIMLLPKFHPTSPHTFILLIRQQSNAKTQGLNILQMIL